MFPTLVFIDPDENTNTTGDWLDGDHKKTGEGRQWCIHKGAYHDEEDVTCCGWLFLGGLPELLGTAPDLG